MRIELLHLLVTYQYYKINKNLYAVRIEIFLNVKNCNVILNLNEHVNAK